MESLRHLSDIPPEISHPKWGSSRQISNHEEEKYDKQSRNCSFIQKAKTGFKVHRI